MWNLRDILSILFKRKHIAIAFFLAVITGTFIFLKLSPPNYAASTKILVKIGREDMYVPALPIDISTQQPMMSVIREEQLNSEVEIIKSDYLANLLIEKMQPEGIYPSMFVEHPWYTPKGLAQSAVALYRDLDNFFAPLSANLDTQQRARKRFLGQDLAVKGTGDSNVIEITVFNKIPSIASDTANNLLDLYMEERGRIHTGYEGEVFQKQIKENDILLQAAQDKLQAFREEHEIVDLDQEIESLQKRSDQIRSFIVDLKAQPSAAKRLQDWQYELKKIQKEMQDLSALELEYTRLQQDVDVLKRSRQVFLEKLEEYRINEALNDAHVGNVSVISRAVVPTTPSSPKLWMVLLAVLIVGIAGAIGLSFLFEFLDDTVETDRDIEKYLQVPLIGKIPVIAK